MPFTQNYANAFTSSYASTAAVQELDFDSTVFATRNIVDMDLISRVMYDASNTRFFWMYCLLSHLRCQVTARVQLIAGDIQSSTGTATQHPAILNYVPPTCYWLPNLVMDLGLQAAGGALKATKVVPARASRDGLYRYRWNWRNTLPKARAWVRISPNYGFGYASITAGTAPQNLFPYGVQRYNAMDNVQRTVFNQPLSGADTTALAAHASIVQDAAMGFPPEMIMRFPGFRVMVPNAMKFGAGAETTIKVQFAFQFDGMFKLKGRTIQGAFPKVDMPAIVCTLGELAEQGVVEYN